GGNQGGGNQGGGNQGGGNQGGGNQGGGNQGGGNQGGGNQGGGNQGGGNQGGGNQGGGNQGGGNQGGFGQGGVPLYDFWNRTAFLAESLLDMFPNLPYCIFFEGEQQWPDPVMTKSSSAQLFDYPSRLNPGPKDSADRRPEKEEG
ncbi:MAG: hypothetical protein GTO03_18220, partial [Planctomycetales bacterium]|nr:hypothetical protein [Planctomycetales bacterium]